MTSLPSTPPISFSQMSAEINVSLPINMNHARLQALVGHNLAISMSEFLGKSGKIDGNFATSGSGSFLSLNSVGGSYYGATVNQIGYNTSSIQTYILFNNGPNYTGDIILINNTTGANVTLTLISTSPWEWSANSTPANLLRAGGNDSFTLKAA